MAESTIQDILKQFKNHLIRMNVELRSQRASIVKLEASDAKKDTLINELKNEIAGLKTNNNQMSTKVDIGNMDDINEGDLDMLSLSSLPSSRSPLIKAKTQKDQKDSNVKYEGKYKITTRYSKCWKENCNFADCIFYHNEIDKDSEIKTDITNKKPCKFLKKGQKSCNSKVCYYAHNVEDLIADICNYGKSCNKTKCRKIHSTKSEYWIEYMKKYNKTETWKDDAFPKVSNTTGKFVSDEDTDTESKVKSSDTESKVKTSEKKEVEVKVGDDDDDEFTLSPNQSKELNEDSDDELRVLLEPSTLPPKISVPPKEEKKDDSSKKKVEPIESKKKSKSSDEEPAPKKTDVKKKKVESSDEEEEEIVPKKKADIKKKKVESSDEESSDEVIPLKKVPAKKSK